MSFEYTDKSYWEAQPIEIIERLLDIFHLALGKDIPNVDHIQISTANNYARYYKKEDIKSWISYASSEWAKKRHKKFLQGRARGWGSGILNNQNQHFSEITSSIDLLNILNNLYPNFDNHVVAVDELNKITPLMNQIIVCNLQTTSDVGSHWVMLVCSDTKYVVYFDSYAVPPDNRTLNFMKKYKNNGIVDNIIMTTKQIQTIDQAICGWYCLMFLYFYINKNQDPFEVIHNINQKNTTLYGKKLSKKFLNNSYSQKNIYGPHKNIHGPHKNIHGRGIDQELYDFFIDPNTSDEYLLGVFRFKMQELDIIDYHAPKKVKNNIHTIAKACYDRGLISKEKYQYIENKIITDLYNLD